MYKEGFYQTNKLQQKQLVAADQLYLPRVKFS